MSRATGHGGWHDVARQLLSKLNPGSIDALAARLPSGIALVSTTNGKTTTTAVAKILEPGHRVVLSRGRANLVSGLASSLVSSRDASLGLFEVDECSSRGRSGGTDRPLSRFENLFRDQLDRYGELELVADRWRGAVDNLPEWTTLVVNAEDPPGRARRGARARAVRSRRSRCSPRDDAAASDSKYCVRCGTPYVYAAAYVGHLGDYRCPRAATSVHRSTWRRARSRSADWRARAFVWTRHRAAHLSNCPFPGLYNVYNAVSAASVALVLGELARGDHARASGLRARHRPLRTDPGRAAKSIIMLLIRKPAGCKRGAAHFRDRRPSGAHGGAERRVAAARMCRGYRTWTRALSSASGAGGRARRAAAELGCGSFTEACRRSTRGGIVAGRTRSIAG